MLTKPKAEKTIKPTSEELTIMNKQFNSVDVINMDDLSTENGVANMIHSMANTKIIAEDGLIWGLIPITKTRVEALRKAVINLNINDPKINDILSRWSKQDFSQCVDEHNYIWSVYLHGNEGKAIALR